MLSKSEEAKLRAVLAQAIKVPNSSHIHLVELAKILAEEKRELLEYNVRQIGNAMRALRELAWDLGRVRELCDSAKELVSQLENAATRVREPKRPKRKPTRAKRPSKRRKAR